MERLQLAHVLALLRLHGAGATSFQILEEGYRYWFDEGGEAVVAYVDTGAAWVAAGAPIADPSRVHEVAQRFVGAARAHRRRAAFFGVGDELESRSELRRTLVGEQPEWDPRQFAAIVAGDRTLRSQVRRARAKHVETRVVPADELGEGTALRRDVEELIEAWLAGRRTEPLGFLVRVQPFDHAEERRFVVATRGAELVGFAVAVPIFARNGWLLEDLLRVPTAPNGTSELLVDTMMRALAAEGSTYVTLGLSPLRGPVAPWLRWFAVAARPFYDFGGLSAFKQKLRPARWTAVYVAGQARRTSFRTLLDGVIAFTGGQLVRFVFRALLRKLRGRPPQLPAVGATVADRSVGG